MSPEDAEEYTQSLGQSLGGNWRLAALADRLGVPKALGLSTREWVEKRLGGHIKLAMPDRREAVKELTADGMSQRKIGEVLGVSKGQIGRDLHDAPKGAGEDETRSGNGKGNDPPAPFGASSEPDRSQRDREAAERHVQYIANALLHLDVGKGTIEVHVKHFIKELELIGRAPGELSPARLTRCAEYLRALALAISDERRNSNAKEEKGETSGDEANAEAAN